VTACPAADTDEALSATLEKVDRAIDQKLGDKKPKRSPEPLAKYVTVKRQLRALAWKHGIEGYGEENLSATELMHRLRAKWVEQGVLKEDGP